MSQVMCAYHPANIAVDKCERCYRPICLIGKRVYRKQHSSGTNEFRNTWTTTHIYCPPCNADITTNDASGVGAIFGSIAFLVILGFIAIPFMAIGGIFAIFPAIMVIIFVLQFKQKAQKADHARQDEKRFLTELNQSPSGISQTGNYSRIKGYSRPDKKWKVSDVSCFNCGSAIDLESNYCMTCGDSTKEERANYGV